MGTLRVKLGFRGGVKRSIWVNWGQRQCRRWHWWWQRRWVCYLHQQRIQVQIINWCPSARWSVTSFLIANCWEALVYFIDLYIAWSGHHYLVVFQYKDKKLVGNKTIFAHILLLLTSKPAGNSNSSSQLRYQQLQQVWNCPSKAWAGNGQPVSVR